MDVTALITQNINRTENVSATDADNTTRRARHLEWLVEVATDFYYGHDWSWSYRRGTATVTSGEKRVVVPSNFHNFGQHGGVLRSADGKRMRFKSEGVIQEMQEDSALATGTPSVYGIFDFDTTNFREYIQTPVASGNVGLVLWFRTVLSVLDESAGVNNIKLIPEKYHQWVLMPGMRALALASLGDSKGNPLELDPAYQRVKTAAIVTDQKGRQEGFRLPSIWGDEEE